MLSYDELDETDRQILRLLQQNSQMTVKELACAINLSINQNCWYTNSFPVADGRVYGCGPEYRGDRGVL